MSLLLLYNIRAKNNDIVFCYQEKSKKNEKKIETKIENAKKKWN